jgi:hypothetical protein
MTTNKVNDEQLKGLVEKTFGPMRSAAATQDIVRAARAASTQEGANMNKRTMSRRAFVGLASCATLLTAGVALAATQHDFLGTAFGPKDHEETEAYEELEEGKDEPYTVPGRQWADTDAETAERLVGAYVEEVNESVSVDSGVTLTVESCVTDANGLCVATFRMEGDDDLGTVYDEQFGEVYWTSDSPACLTVAGSADLSDFDAMYDSRSIYYADALTPTSVEAVMYYGPFGPTDEGGLDTVTWILRNNRVDYDDPSYQANLEYTPSTVVPTQAFASADGVATASVSPLGMVLGATDADGGVSWRDASSITFTDGSTYVLHNSELYNTVVSWEMRGDCRTVARMFNQLVDVDDIAYITAAWCSDDDPVTVHEVTLERVEG